MKDDSCLGQSPADRMRNGNMLFSSTVVSLATAQNSSKRFLQFDASNYLAKCLQ